MPSGQPHVKIVDLVPIEYDDFLRYCSGVGKVFCDELSTVDYVTYRSQFGREKKQVKQLRALIESGAIVDNSSCSVDDLGQAIVDERQPDPKEKKSVESLAPLDKVSNVENGEQAFITDGGRTASSQDHTTNDEDGFSKEKNPSRVALFEAVPDKEIPATDDPQLVISQRFQSKPELINEHSTGQEIGAVVNNDNSNFTYAEIFEIDADAYADFCIEPDLQNKFSISLSIRPLNCLRKAKCKSIKDLWLLTPKKLSSIQNLGSKSIREIEQALFTLSRGTLARTRKILPRTGLSARWQVFLPVLDSMLRGNPYSKAELSESERTILAKAEDAADILGADFCIRIMHGEDCPYVRVITETFSEFSSKTEIRRRIITSATEAITCWSSEILSAQLSTYIQIYCSSRKDGISDEFIALLSSDAPVNDYPKILSSKINLDSKNLSNLAMELKAFEAWMNGIDINNICESIFSRDKNARYFDVLFTRTEGYKLEEIAQQCNLTRERVRQMESKALRIVKKRVIDGNYNIIALISAFRNGDNVLHKSEIAEVIGERLANLLWYCATRTRDRGISYLLDSNLSHYDSAHDVIVTLGRDFTEQDGADSDNAKIEQIIAELPALIETIELQKLLEILPDEHGLSPKLLHIAANKAYKEAGKYSYRGNLTVAQMCSQVLKKRFQNGFKIADETDSAQFQKYLFDFFGDKGSMTAHAVDTKIMQIGVLIDRGKYIHKDYVDVDRQIVSDIFSYVESSPKTAITYSEIYSSFQERFTGTAIANRYALQGIMKLYNSPYASRKDYISKDGEGNVGDELDTFVKTRGKVHKSEILEEFPGWKDHNIAFVLQRCPEVIGIDGGYYIHASNLSVHEDDYNAISKYLHESVQEIPVSARYLFDGFMDRFPMFMIENDIQSYGALFGILQYLFSGDFYFSRPYIAKDNIANITNKSVLLKHLEGVNGIEIDDFVDLCQQNGVNYTGISYLIDMMQPEFVRVDNQRLMRFVCVGFSEEMWQDVEDLITEAVSAHGGYLSASRISDFSWYPALNIQWTPFLLESIASMIPSGINTVKMVSSSIKVPHSIFVSEEYADDDWISLIVKILKKEHEAEPFTSKTAILEWLQSEGLCNAKYPASLDTENHVYYDQDGRLIIQ